MRGYLMAGGLLIAAGLASAAPSPESDLSSRRKTMNSLLAEHWDYTLSHNPEFASILGDKRWNDKLSDFSQEAIEQDLAKAREFLGRFEAIEPAGFPEQEALTRTLLLRGFREQLEDARFKNWQMPVTQMSGIHLDAPRLVALLSFETVKDYEDYLARLKALPRVFDQTVAQMRRREGGPRRRRSHPDNRRLPTAGRRSTTANVRAPLPSRKGGTD
jgi:uncharacterized protein (DUF885 family)